MKIIFSRKGFDSSSGGEASPILPDNWLVSLPIPSKEDEIRFDQASFSKGQSYWDLMKELRIDNNLPRKCHLDPDLERSVIKRQNGWLPNFGQRNGPQTQLMNQEVEVGDLFLFFGWFKKTERKNGQLEYVNEKFADLHVLFGYLEIGKILRVNKKENVEPWLAYHPHCLPFRMKTKNNTIYVATPKLSGDKNLPGGGTFRFHEDLNLTKEGESRSNWKLDRKDFPGLWSKKGNFKPRYRGQEFVIRADNKAIRWAKNLVSKHAKA